MAPLGGYGLRGAGIEEWLATDGNLSRRRGNRCQRNGHQAIQGEVGAILSVGWPEAGRVVA